MDYEKLIDELSRFSEYIPLYMRDDDGSSDIALRAADAIETLLKERDAAIEAFRGECGVCKNDTRWDSSEPCESCKYWEWAKENAKSDNWEWCGTREETV